MSVTNPEIRRAEVRGDEPESLELTLWDIFEGTASAFPHRDAVVSMWQSNSPLGLRAVNGEEKVDGKGPYLRWSYECLFREANGLSMWLQGLGCKLGMKLAAVLWNSAEWALFLWSTAKLGMIFVPIDPRATKDLPSLFDRLNVQVVVAQDEETAEAIESLDLGSATERIKIQCSGLPTLGWMGIKQESQLYWKARSFGAQEKRLTGEYYNPASHNVFMMVLTSGTTGEPKICPHTHRNLISQACEYDPKPEDPKERWLVHTPISHIFAINNTLRAWKEGGTVVFPAKSFNVESTLQALGQEKCTIMSATPTLIKTLLSHPGFAGSQSNCLDLVTIGGTTITHEDVRLCREGLGSNNAIQAYGMTEGAPLISWRRHDNLLQEGYHPGVGRVLPGAAARICSPGTKNLLDIGETGELHIAGSSVISSYYGNHECSVFYDDGGLRWLMTGDQGMIDQHDIVHLMGRYKDLIIRGGENIQPGKIEKVLSEVPGLQVSSSRGAVTRMHINEAQAAVVGVPDTLAGQVPVAIVKLPAGVDKSAVAKKTLVLGPTFALGGVYTLEELDLSSFPVTALGKVKKGILAELATEYRQKSYASATDDASRGVHEALVSSLIDAWEQVTATRPGRDQDILYLADSISMLRFCDAVVRLCGKQVYIQDLVNHNTVEKQARLLAARDRVSDDTANPASAVLTTATPSQSNAAAPAPEVSPTYSGLTPSSNLKHQLRQAAGRSALKGLGLPEEDLEDIIPIRTSLRRFAVGQRPQSYHIAFSFRVPGVSTSRLQMAISQLVAHHPLLRAILCRAEDGQLFHAISAHSDSLMQYILFHDEVNTAEEATEYAGHLDTSSHNSTLMLRATIVRCREDGLNYTALTFSHTIMDALTVVPWHRNLDLLLQGRSAKLPEMTPYSLFSDLHDSYSDSRLATEAVNFHMKRLRGISLLKRALWPVQRAPGWMISDDSGSTNARERALVREQVWEGRWESASEDYREPRISHLVNLLQLSLLTDRYGVAPVDFSKAAIMLLNVLQTGVSHAIFTSWESGRSWPFLPKWIEDKLPPAMSIDGPTVEWLLNMMEVDWNETVSEFLKRVQEEQRQMLSKEHAPWSHIARELHEEGEVATQASFRQAFVWDVSLLGMVLPKGYLTEFEVLEPVNRHNWADW